MLLRVVHIAFLVNQVKAVPIKVMVSTPKLLESYPKSEARLTDNRIVNITDITMCLRFNFKLLGSSLIRVDDYLLWLGAGYPYSFFGFGYPIRHGSYKSWLLKDPDTGDFEVWASNRWSHMCLAYNKATGLVRIVKDGKAMNINKEDPLMTGVEIPSNFLSRTFIGGTSPEGQMSDFNIWDRTLSLQELQDWTSCKSMIKGNLVNWETAEFDAFNMTTEMSTTEALCIPPRPGMIIFPEQRNITEHLAICHKMRGLVSIIRDNQAGDWWTGWWDEPKDGTFSNVNNASDVLKSSDFQPWYYGEPNGDTMENCGVVSIGWNMWNDVTCDVLLCGFCDLERAPDIQIRGLCKESLFNTKYSWTRTFMNGRHSFRGYTNTLMSWDTNITMWRLQIYDRPNTYATVNMTEYPLGTNTWDIYGDNCFDSNHTAMLLNVNACNDSEFNCLDGYCINIDLRCDGKVDCTDKTDEIGCELLLMDASYIKDLPASPDQQSGATELAAVLVSMDILSILDISEVQNFISLQLQLWLTWRDKRLTMVDLKKDQDLNTLTPEFRNKIWIPEIVFYNTQEKLESLNDEKAFATIRRNASYQMSPKQQLQNAYFFKGEENPITVSRVYNSEFLCEFNMAVYPFDTQRCSVIVIMKGNSGKFARLIQENLRYLGPIDLRQYFVKDTLMLNHTVPPDVEAVKVDIIFGRRILAPILTTYLPTILICLVAFGTNYYKAFFFEAVVTVNLTCLLVLATLFISVSDSLPKTSYIKMIDIWLIVNLLIPFAEVLLHTYIDSLRLEEGSEVNHHGRKHKIGEGKLDEKVNTVDDIADVYINGKVIKVNEYLHNRNPESKARPPELIARDDTIELEALKLFYEKSKVSNEKYMRMATRIASQGLPLIFILFVIGYFAVGMAYFNGIIQQ
ncbi:unnamed protein product [Sphagnum tenellum]